MKLAEDEVRVSGYETMDIESGWSAVAPAVPCRAFSAWISRRRTIPSKRSKSWGVTKPRTSDSKENWAEEGQIDFNVKISLSFIHSYVHFACCCTVAYCKADGKAISQSSVLEKLEIICLWFIMFLFCFLMNYCWLWENQEAFKSRGGRKNQTELKVSARSLGRNLRRAQISSVQASKQSHAHRLYMMSTNRKLILFWSLYFCTPIISHLRVCVEQLEQRHHQLLHANVSIPVLLHIVAHGLPLCLCQQVTRLLLQHRTGLVHQTGQSDLRSCHAFIKPRLV